MEETCSSFLAIAPAGRVFILVKYYVRPSGSSSFNFQSSPSFSLCLSLSYASAIDLLITREAVSANAAPAATFAFAVQHLAERERPAAPDFLIDRLKIKTVSQRRPFTQIRCGSKRNLFDGILSVAADAQHLNPSQLSLCSTLCVAPVCGLNTRLQFSSGQGRLLASLARFVSSPQVHYIDLWPGGSADQADRLASRPFQRQPTCQKISSFGCQLMLTDKLE